MIPESANPEGVKQASLSFFILPLESSSKLQNNGSTSMYHEGKRALNLLATKIRNNTA